MVRDRVSPLPRRLLALGATVTLVLAAAAPRAPAQGTEPAASFLTPMFAALLLPAAIPTTVPLLSDWFISLCRNCFAAVVGGRLRSTSRCPCSQHPRGVRIHTWRVTG